MWMLDATGRLAWNGGQQKTNIIDNIFKDNNKKEQIIIEITIMLVDNNIKTMSECIHHHTTTINKI